MSSILDKQCNLAPVSILFLWMGRGGGHFTATSPPPAAGMCPPSSPRDRHPGRVPGTVRGSLLCAAASSLPSEGSGPFGVSVGHIFILWIAFVRRRFEIHLPLQAAAAPILPCPFFPPTLSFFAPCPCLKSLTQRRPQHDGVIDRSPFQWSYARRKGSDQSILLAISPSYLPPTHPACRSGHVPQFEEGGVSVFLSGDSAKDRTSSFLQPQSQSCIPFLLSIRNTPPLPPNPLPSRRLFQPSVQPSFEPDHHQTLFLFRFRLFSSSERTPRNVSSCPVLHFAAQTASRHVLIGFSKFGQNTVTYPSAHNFLLVNFIDFSLFIDFHMFSLHLLKHFTGMC